MVVVFVVGMLGVVYVDVGDGLKVVCSNVCMGCYVVDCKFVGLLFKDIVVCYKFDL